MPSEAHYIHGTARTEQARLQELNRLPNAAFVSFVGATAGARVLEVGSGLGILAQGVANSAPGVSVVGLERSPEQIRSARPASGVTYIEGDAHELRFPDASFDVVYCRY